MAGQYNGYYTRQEQDDALVTQIVNPNRVGSGFIDLGPQKRFASSTANWQTSALVGGGGAPPKPLTDIQNAPRPSPIGLPPPPAPVAQKPPQVAQKPPAPLPPPVVQKINEAKKPPPARPTDRKVRPRGKDDVNGGQPEGRQRRRAPAAAAPAAPPVDAVAALAAQLAADEALARQLAEELQQMEEPVAAPEPVAALAEQPAAAKPAPQQRKGKAKKAAAEGLPAPAAKAAPQPKAAATETTSPTEATTGDATAKRVRALRKKVRDIEVLEERQLTGAAMQQDQLDKIAAKAAIVKELGALACDTTEKEDGAPIGDAAFKQVRALRKKVRDIELLEEKQREGAILEPNQLVKIAGKAAIVKELGALLA